MGNANPTHYCGDYDIIVGMPGIPKCCRPSVAIHPGEEISLHEASIEVNSYLADSRVYGMSMVDTPRKSMEASPGATADVKEDLRLDLVHCPRSPLSRSF